MTESLVPATAVIGCGGHLQRRRGSTRTWEDWWNPLRPTDCARVFRVDCHEIHVTDKRVEHHHRRCHTLRGISRVRTDLKERDELGERHQFQTLGLVRGVSTYPRGLYEIVVQPPRVQASVQRALGFVP